MDKTKLKALVTKIIKLGPIRVVFNVHGEATTPEIAEENYQVKPTTIYIRDDGWSLGTPEEFDFVAQKIWFDDWIAVVQYNPVTRTWSWRPWGSQDEPEEVK